MSHRIARALEAAKRRNVTANAVDPERGLLVCEKRCNECLFSSNALADTASIVEKCEREGSYFICHKATIAGRAVVCRGFYDYANTKGSNVACQIAHRLGLVCFTDPEK